MMSFAFGGLAVLSVPRHTQAWSSLVDIRSMFLALVVSLVLVVLAYMTNPSETSFRAFLTEQSFRHHLTKLDDVQDDHQIDYRKRHVSLLDGSPAKHNSLDASPFQFADRASVSLRTPKHFFRSFGVASVAAVLPSGAGPVGHPRSDGTNPSKINNSWFIGAFGLWWYAHLDGFWRNSGLVDLKEEVGASIFGILDMKALDGAHDRHVLPSSHDVQRSSNSKQRSRERFNQQRHSSGNVIANRRSSTPPPLPRSASLPLHAKRPAVPSNHSLNDNSRTNDTAIHPVTQHTRLHQTQAHSPMITVGLNEPTPSPGSSSPSSTSAEGTVAQHPSTDRPTPSSSPSTKSPAVAFADSPQIAEILNKVDSAQASVNELQDQLSAATASASANATTRQLQMELEQQRARKQADDASRTEIRTRTRALEDSKRHAESNKREVEKRLKSVQSAAATSERRATTLTAEATALRVSAKAHAERSQRSRSEADNLCEELRGEVEGRKAEVKDVEDVLTALVRRVKELEASVAEEEQRLKRAYEKAQARKRFEPVVDETTAFEEPSVWPIKPPREVKQRVAPPGLDIGFNGLASPVRFDSPVEPPSSGYFSRQSVLPKIRNEPVPTTTFAPFSPLSEHREDNPISPLSTSFIPSSLIESLGIRSTAPTTYSPSIAVHRSPLSSSDQHEMCISPMSRSFQSDDDVILDRRENLHFNGFGLAPGSGAPSTFAPTPASLSPSSPHRSVTDERNDDANSMNGSFENGTLLDSSTSVSHQPILAKNKRLGWFAKERKGHSASVGGGLNPDAKEFNLPKDRARTLPFMHSKPRSATVTAAGSSSDGSVNGVSPSYDSNKAHTPDSSGSSSSFAPSFEDGSISTSSTSSLSSFSSMPAASKLLGLSGVSGLGAAWLGTTPSAFAPTPTERQALSRALTGSRNTSVDQLPMFLSSASTSPQPLQAPAILTSTLRTPGLISRPAWFDSLRHGKAGTTKTSFSPFDDENMSA